MMSKIISVAIYATFGICCFIIGVTHYNDVSTGIVAMSASIAMFTLASHEMQISMMMEIEKSLMETKNDCCKKS